MARLSLSKAELQKQSRSLASYERFLPSLDLKRRQLIAERAKAEEAIRATRAALQQLRQRVADELPMAAHEGVDLTGLVVVRHVELGQQNVVGARLPVLQSVAFDEAAYSDFARPHWVDRLKLLVKEGLALTVRADVEKRRLDLLNQAVRKITQRVNLFEKVLIPRTRSHIKRIRIHLADLDRAAVVRSKIAKKKRATLPGTAQLD